LLYLIYFASLGKGFTIRNLWAMRQFYIQFPILHAVRAELSWTHYRSLIRIENPKAREVYMNEAADNAWSTRFLDEQVDKHYCERLLVTHKDAVKDLNDKAKLAIK
jgi:DNA-directed RNA polymerase subunit N (RpoN/RPB10)